jgi:hypothetical protein
MIPGSDPGVCVEPECFPQECDGVLELTALPLPKQEEAEPATVYMMDFSLCLGDRRLEFLRFFRIRA